MRCNEKHKAHEKHKSSLSENCCFHTCSCDSQRKLLFDRTIFKPVFSNSSQCHWDLILSSST